ISRPSLRCVSNKLNGGPCVSYSPVLKHLPRTCCLLSKIEHTSLLIELTTRLCRTGRCKTSPFLCLKQQLCSHVEERWTMRVPLAVQAPSMSKVRGLYY